MNKKLILFIVLILAGLLLAGCNYPSSGKQYRITLYSNGQVVRTWKASSAFILQDHVTFTSNGNETTVYGTFVIEETPE